MTLSRLILTGLLVLAVISASAQPLAPISPADSAFLRTVQKAAFGYFWHEANPANGLIRDRNTPTSPASIAAVGFGLTSICIGVDNGWITREAARDRVRNTLEFFWYAPQGPEPQGNAGYHGFFYHFLTMDKGVREWNCELSSIDTGLLLLGILDARQYFDQSDTVEVQIRALADSISRRVDWTWLAKPDQTIGNGWFPEQGFIRWGWRGYNEGLFLPLLAMGSPTHALPDGFWKGWTRGYQWETHYGLSFFAFPPLFGHQYPQCWLDLRTLLDDATAERGITYFENARRATLANRAYCIENPLGYRGYSDSIWGLTACDGPDVAPAKGYFSRGAPNPEIDDGTIAPTAAGSSLPFTPTESLRAMKAMYALLCSGADTRLWGPYGFRDAFNLTMNWVDKDCLGIDQGPLVLMIENFMTQGVWKRFMRVPEIQAGLKKAGFRPA